MLLLYKTFIRPILEYGTVITSPPKKNDVRLVESVQNSFTRRLFSRQKGRYVNHTDFDYKTAAERNSFFGLTSLEHRRKAIDNLTIKKMIAGRIDLKTSEFFNVLLENHNTGTARPIANRRDPPHFVCYFAFSAG